MNRSRSAPAAAFDNRAEMSCAPPGTVNGTIWVPGSAPVRSRRPVVRVIWRPARTFGAASPQPSPDSGPANPGLTATSTEPEALSVLAVTGDGTVAKAGLSEIGSRSVRPSRRLVRTSAPYVYWPSGAVVRV